ncbi:MAG: hypothetical protein K1X71_04485 [Pirellulales bacterium]|nr:hypothetical protein [Pirellulales bacterium]
MLVDQFDQGDARFIGVTPASVLIDVVHHPIDVIEIGRLRSQVPYRLQRRGAQRLALHRLQPILAADQRIVDDIDVGRGDRDVVKQVDPVVAAALGDRGERVVLQVHGRPVAARVLHRIGPANADIAVEIETEFAEVIDLLVDGGGRLAQNSGLGTPQFQSGPAGVEVPVAHLHKTRGRLRRGGARRGQQERNHARSNKKRTCAHHISIL